MSLSVKRWCIILAGVVANICQGVAYTSSVFMLQLGEVLNRPQELWSREWGMIFAMSLAFLPVGMLLSGRLADLGYTRLTAGIGAVLYGCGLLLASRGYSVVWVALTLGMMTSVGSGFAYGTIIAAVIRWFPDKRGFASGLVIAAVGLGPIILAPIVGRLMSAYGVMNMLAILGVICLICMGCAAACLVNPPAGYVPQGWTPPNPAGTAVAAVRTNFNWKQIVRLPLFWMLYVAYFCATFTGILVSGMIVPIAIELAGFTSARAPIGVMVFALCSAGGRVLWGLLSDKVGRVFMVGTAFVLTVIAMFVLHSHVATAGMFLPCVGLAGLCYGGVLATFPSLSADCFGVKNAAVNFAVLGTAFALAAIAGPQVVAHYRNSGIIDYPKAFLVAGCVAAVGFVMSIIITRVRARAADSANAGTPPPEGEKNADV